MLALTLKQKNINKTYAKNVALAAPKEDVNNSKLKGGYILKKFIKVCY